MSIARENAMWAGCGGPTRRITKWNRDGFTIVADRDARLSVQEVKAGQYRPRGHGWYPSRLAALAWIQRMYP